ncbi:glycosyltransferase family 2 protein [Reichenbachiella sp.]|uniref:glycosyltransferase family 2 protein n=1 Tax=Reichenbachiella sp. TaxID=2184521 RepID=UPI003B590FFC
MNKSLSVVIPVYLGKSILPELVSQLVSALEVLQSEFEIILVDDGCPQDSWSAIVKESHTDKRIKGVKLAKNFGQQNAINAGLEKVRGDFVVVMDCDLQDKPDEIINLYKEAKKGFDIVFARRIDRTDRFLKRLMTSIFYKVFSFLLGVPYDGTIANFGIYKRHVIDQYNQLVEKEKVFFTLIRSMGFISGYIEVKHGERYKGESSYSWNKLIKLAIRIFISYSDRPLHLVIQLGFTISSLAVLFVIYSIWSKLSGNIHVPGYASIVASIWFFSGLIIFILGVIGLYLAQVFKNVKQRPDYYVQKTENF